MTIKERITEDMKNAMRAHDTARLSALRLLLAAIKQREVDDRVEATDELVTGVIGKLIKQRRHRFILQQEHTHERQDDYGNQHYYKGDRQIFLRFVHDYTVLCL